MKRIMFILLIVAAFSCKKTETGAQRKCGSDFSAYGLAGKTYNEALDFVGQTHNDYQDYVLKELSILKPDFTDTSKLKSLIYDRSAAFFKMRGFNFDNNLYALKLGVATAMDLGINPKNYSPEGNKILLQLEGLVNNYEPNNDEVFFQKLSSLKEEALSLPDEKEVFTVGIPVSVAIHSLQYWKLNGQKWLSTFTVKEDVIQNKEVECQINLWKIGGADVGGAITGAMGGSVLGVGGALAGGVLGSSMSSLAQLSNQVISCFVSWWPF